MIKGPIRIDILFTRKNNFFLNHLMYMILKIAVQKVIWTAILYFLLKSGLAKNSIVAGASA